MVEVNVQTRAVMLRLTRYAQRIGLAIVKSQDGRARRFVAWGREIEYVALETGAVRASALVDEQVMATSTKSVEWMQQFMLKARADQLSRTAAPATARFVRRAPSRHGQRVATPWRADRGGTSRNLDGTQPTAETRRRALERRRSS